MSSKTARTGIVLAFLAAMTGGAVVAIASKDTARSGGRSASAHRDWRDARNAEEARCNAERADAPSAWQPAYGGNARVSGRLHLADGSSGAGAHVLCIPAGLRPCTPQQYETLTATCDDDGAFAFPALPASAFYFFAAWRADTYAQATLGGRQVREGAVSLMLRPLSYERVTFVDDAGSAIDVSRRILTPLSNCAVLASSHLPNESPAILYVLGKMGIDLAVRPNEALHILRADAQSGRSDTPCGGGKLPEEITIQLPGYTEAVRSIHLRTLDEWPAGDRVELTRSDDRTVLAHRVAFPETTWPERWAARDPVLEPRLYATIEGHPRRIPLTPDLNVFYAPPDAKVRLELGGIGPLDFARDRAGDEIAIRPVYPKTGYVEIRYPPGADPDTYYRLDLLPEHATERAIQTTSFWAGHARAGPVPVGHYLLHVYARPIERVAPRKLARSLGRVEVRPGLNLFRFDGNW